MIKAEKAREITTKYSDYSIKVMYYEELASLLIEDAAKDGRNNCILKIKEDKNAYEIAVKIGNILIDNGYTYRFFKEGSKYGFWIFW